MTVAHIFNIVDEGLRKALLVANDPKLDRRCAKDMEDVVTALSSAREWAHQSLEEGERIKVPRQLFLDLVLLQAQYAELLNVRDGGERRPLKLPEPLFELLTPREREARDLCHRDGGMHGFPRTKL